VRKEYLELSLEELLEDPAFIAWVLRNENAKVWELFLSENPNFRNTAKKARGIIELLKERDETLAGEDIASIWKNIEQYDDLFAKRRPILFRYKIFRYAAILILAISIGGSAGYWYWQKNTVHFEFTESANNSISGKSRLSLSNGTIVDLEKEDSKVAMNGNRKITIDNEKEIDLGKDNPEEDGKMNEVVIPYGKKSQLILEDGTKVWLNAGSRMAFPTKFRGKTREVILEGEAYFEVVTNQAHPFVVNTGAVAIKVLGTKFNLSAYKGDVMTEAVLIEGKISLSERSALGYLKKETILAPNQKVSYNSEDHAITVKEEPNADLRIAWIDGMFRFSQQSLQEVLNKLQRYYNVQFVVDPEIPSADLITGKLDLKDSIESVMLALSDVVDLKYRIEGNKIWIEKK